MLRIRKKRAISFPCSNHIFIKLQVLLTSKPPITEELPYEFYNIPDIRVITLRDFKLFYERRKIEILHKYAISTHYKAASGKIVKFLPSWLARYGIFLITRQ